MIIFIKIFIVAVLRVSQMTKKNAKIWKGREEKTNFDAKKYFWGISNENICFRLRHKRKITFLFFSFYERELNIFPALVHPDFYLHFVHGQHCETNFEIGNIPHYSFNSVACFFLRIFDLDSLNHFFQKKCNIWR